MNTVETILALIWPWLRRRWPLLVKTASLVVAASFVSWVYWPHSPATAPARTIGCALYDWKVQDLTNQLLDVVRPVLDSVPAASATTVPAASTTKLRPSRFVPGC